MKKVIKLKLSELKNVIQNTIEEQNQFLNPYQTSMANLKCIDSKQFDQKSANGKMFMVYDNPKVGPNGVSERVVLYADGAGDLIVNGKHIIGKWNCGTNGVEFRPNDDLKNVRYLGNLGKVSATQPKPQEKPKPQINVANCANQLVDVTKGKILKFGCKTQGVKELQTLFDMVTPTGYFGNKTLGMVKKIQQENGIKVDGIVGPETYPYIIKLGSTS
jgi:peptidoglycan hydrolase-like protein with peptidoglycan-binding domain